MGQVQNLNLNLSDLSLTVVGLPVLNAASLAHFTQAADTVLQSDSTVTGDANSFSRVGTSQIADLSLSINGGANTSLSALLTANSVAYSLAGGVITGVAPNTSITLGAALQAGLAAGVSLDAAAQMILTFNEQILDDSGDPNLNPRITTTALHIHLLLPGAGMGLAVSDALPVPLLAGTLAATGDINVYLGQSQAQLLAVPEPSTYAAGIALAGAIGGLWIRNVRRNRNLTVQS
jgi:hypothetical protein